MRGGAHFLSLSHCRTITSRSAPLGPLAWLVVVWPIFTLPPPICRHMRLLLRHPLPLRLSRVTSSHAAASRHFMTSHRAIASCLAPRESLPAGWSDCWQNQKGASELLAWGGDEYESRVTRKNGTTGRRRTKGYKRPRERPELIRLSANSCCAGLGQSRSIFSRVRRA